MIKSMTGYGSAKGLIGSKEVNIEIRSVNNRYLDINIKSPRNYMFAEDIIKGEVQSFISRGKIDVFFSVVGTAAANSKVTVNEELARSYFEALENLSSMLNINNDVTALNLARFPDVLSVENVEDDKEEVAREIKSLTAAALRDFDGMRAREGENLKNNILLKLENILYMVSQIEEASPKTCSDYQDRLYAKVKEVLDSNNVDEGRLLTEVAIFADRVAVDEETVRLRSHISQMQQMLSGSSPIGRKLDFLIQEFNREANTIGSKCMDSEIAHTVVDLKAEIEKIREQIQNIE